MPGGVRPDNPGGPGLCDTRFAPLTSHLPQLSTTVGLGRPSVSSQGRPKRAGVGAWASLEKSSTGWASFTARVDHKQGAGQFERLSE